MGSRNGSRAAALGRRPVLLQAAMLMLVLACVTLGFSAVSAFAAPAAPVISGPSAIQFSYHPSGFRAQVIWDAVPTATEYRIYNADTLVHLGTVTSTNCMIYGMQGVSYHHYVVAVDAAGEVSPPSNLVDILTTAPLPPALPTGFSVLPTSVFDLQTSTAPAGVIPVKIPYNPADVTGDPSSLRLMHYTAGQWEDITTSVDTTNSFVFGATTSFSVFAVLQPDSVTVSTITPSAGTHGSITPGTVQTVAFGADSTTFTITPDAGYRIDDVVVDGVSIGAVGGHTFTNVTADHSISAGFSAIPVTLSTSTQLFGPSQLRFRRTRGLTGTISPATAPGTVRLSAWVLVAGVWQGAGTAQVAAIDGAYLYAFTPTRRGAWRFVATYTGGVDGATIYSPSTSAAKTVIVR